MDNKIQLYGFFIPPFGEFVEIECSHMEYCKGFIDNIACQKIKGFYKLFLDKYIKYACMNPGLVFNPYVDFCMMILGWCQVGNLCPSKSLKLCMRNEDIFCFQQKVYVYGKRHGFVVEKVLPYSWIDDIEFS